MSFTELLEAAKMLPREEQLQLIEGLQQTTQRRLKVEHLANEMARGPALEFWSPLFASDTAEALQQMLEDEKNLRSGNASA